MVSEGASAAGLARLLHERLHVFGDHIAIEQDSKALTFHELHHRASVVAHKIRGLAVQKEEPVPILAARGIDHVVCQMAIIYAGAACVPLDVDLPDERIADLLRHLGPSVLLTDAQNNARCPSLRHILVDSSSSCTNAVSYLNEICDNGPRSCSHVFFTSGSTGKPKAVRVLAMGVINLILNETFTPIARGSRVGHVCNVGFDVSLWEIWSALLHGATLVVFSRDETLDPAVFSKKVKRASLDVMWQTTSLLATITHAYPAAYSTVDTLVTGGEAINIQTVRKIFANGPPRRLINAYGPTELSVLTTFYQVSQEDVEVGSIPIGRPLGGYTAYVVDEELQPVPDGTAGELLVGGAGVAAGYLGDPEKTAMVFVGAPHLPILGHTSTGLLYRTGDLVRRNPAGLIEYLGRRDNEVKISGQRVDLESIERCLLETKLVSTAVALKATELQSSGGSTILVAYVVPSSSRVVQKSIKEAYVQRASHLMVPRLKLVDAIPLTPSGKVDRKQLAREFQEELEQHSIVNEAATTENVEDTMRKLWGQVLGMPAAGISAEEDFFSLGGTSLHAARLISRINRVFDVPLRVAALFESPTLFGMSEEVRKARLGAQYEESLRAQPWMRDSNLGQGLTASIAEAIDWQRESEGRVFLTGATGFVGAFLLKELLSHPQVKKVACLVRAQDENCALLRIRRVLDRYGLSISTEQEALIVPLPGDVVHDHLGLSHGQYQHWANWTSVIFHLAAHVNYLQPYSSHHAVNVLGTLNMLRFSQEGKSKPLHYTSSISAYGPTELVNSTKHIPEDERPQGHQAALEYDTGYAQSQFTAEMIAWNAIDQGLPVTIHRLGVVLGHSSSGTTNLNDFISLLVRTCLRSGVYPSLPGHSEEFVPVDFVVSSMLRISSHRENSGTAYNILHPGTGRMRHLSLFQLIKQQSGRPLIEKPYDEWITTVSQTQDCELSSIMPMLVEKVSDGRSRWQMQANMPTFGIENLHRALSGIPGSLRCPPLGALLEIYIGQWIQQSYVHPN